MKHLTSNTNPVIVSFASKGRDDYNKGQVRLLESLQQHWAGDYWLHSLERDGELPSSKAFPHQPHSECPYLFKFTMIQTLREQGYSRIIWLDSTMVLERPDITDLLKRGIMAFHNLGHDLKNYINDAACSGMNYDTESEHQALQTWGGAIGFDFNRGRARAVFDAVVRNRYYFKDGNSTRPGFIAHRHDQAVLSVMLWYFSVKLHPYGTIVTHPHYIDHAYGNEFYLSHRPIT